MRGIMLEPRHYWPSQPTEDRHGYGEIATWTGESTAPGLTIKSTKRNGNTRRRISYVGDWRADKKHGRGVVHYPHGAIDKGVETREER